jgi:predicted DNA-binding protein
MATVKVTFTLDEATVKRLETASRRLALPKSQVIREAVEGFYERMGQMSEQERKRMLRIFDEVMPRIPPRRPGEVRRGLKEIRLARRRGGRSTTVEP